MCGKPGMLTNSLVFTYNYCSQSDNIRSYRCCYGLCLLNTTIVYLALVKVHIDVSMLSIRLFFNPGGLFWKIIFTRFENSQKYLAYNSSDPSRAQRAILTAADSDQGLRTDFPARLGPRIYRGAPIFSLLAL